MLNTDLTVSNASAQLSNARQVNKPLDQQSAPELYQQFVGETFFQQMFKAMRSSLGETAYMSGGQAEKMFQTQLDAELAAQMAQTHGEMFVSPALKANASLFPQSPQVH